MQHLHLGGPLHGQRVHTPGTLTYTPDGYPGIQPADKQYTLVIISGEEVYALARWCYRKVKTTWQHQQKAAR